MHLDPQHFSSQDAPNVVTLGHQRRLPRPHYHEPILIKSRLPGTADVISRWSRPNTLFLYFCSRRQPHFGPGLCWAPLYGLIADGIRVATSPHRHLLFPTTPRRPACFHLLRSHGQQRTKAPESDLAVVSTRRPGHIPAGRARASAPVLPSSASSTGISFPPSHFTPTLHGIDRDVWYDL